MALNLTFKKVKLESSSDLTAVLVHGFKGNVNSLDIFKNVFKGFREIYSLQAPIRVGSQGFSEEFSWYSDTVDYDPASDIIDFLHSERISVPRAAFMGFSQGGIVLSEVKLKIPDLNIISLCSKVSDKVFSSVPGGKAGFLFYYVGSQDKIIDPEISVAGYRVFREFFKSSVIVIDNAAHKVGTFGIRFLKSWVRQIFFETFY